MIWPISKGTRAKADIPSSYFEDRIILMIVRHDITLCYGKGVPRLVYDHEYTNECPKTERIRSFCRDGILQAQTIGNFTPLRSYASCGMNHALMIIYLTV